MTREPIYLALLALLQNATGIKNVGRKFIPLSDLQPEQLPYLLQLEIKEVSEMNGRGIPAKWVAQVEALVVLPTSGDIDAQSPFSVANPLIDAIEAVFGVDPNLGPQTLGKLVSQARIKGAVEKGQDKTGTKGWFIVPIEIIVPA